MGKPRVRGSHAKISIDGVEVGEISKFSVKELGELKKSRAIGEHKVTSAKTFEGYDLSFEGGKVDWKLAQLMHLQNKKIVNNQRSPYFTVRQQITYYDGTVENYTYNNVTLHGYNLDIDANDEMMEKFEGFCGSKRVRTGADAEQVLSDNQNVQDLITQLINARGEK